MVILKDGVRYNLWPPKDEVKDFEPMIIHHIKDIFGPRCEYFPKQKLKTLANIRSIPDGFVVDFHNEKWCIVELKLLCDDAIRRISGQIVDYKNARRNHRTLRNIYKSIKSIKDADLLDDLINEENPEIIIIIDSLDGEQGRQFIEKVEGTEKHAKIIEFKTFFREGTNPKEQHIHFFEPLFSPESKMKKPSKKEIKSKITIVSNIKEISRKELKKYPKGQVAVFPSKPSGVNWMQRNKAWGYVKIGRSPKYLALYVSSPYHSVQYLAEIDKIVDPTHPKSPVRDSYSTDESYKPGKKVILLKKRSLRKLKPEIRYGTERSHIQSLRYTTIDVLRRAKTMDDLW